MNTERKLKVAVVFGGKGPEHAISCLGAGNVLSAIDRSKYERHPDRDHDRGQLARSPRRARAAGDHRGRVAQR